MKTKRYMPILLISLAAIMFIIISLFSTRSGTDKEAGKNSKEPLGPVLDLSSSVKKNNKEPLKPVVDLNSSDKEKAEIKAIPSLPTQEAFISPTQEAFISPAEEAFIRIRNDISITANDQKLHEETLSAFLDSSSEAIDVAMQYLQLPIVEIVDGKRVDRAEDFHLARNILQVFSDEAVPELIKLYKSGNVVTKANVIPVLGGMPVDPDIPNVRDLLIGALGNQSFGQSELPEMLGVPLRVCDVAYNQLVLRYEVKDVPRTIGTVHKIEDRDYYIERLKDIFAGVVGKEPIL